MQVGKKKVPILRDYASSVGTKTAKFAFHYLFADEARTVPSTSMQNTNCFASYRYVRTLPKKQKKTISPLR